ncbi:MAG: ABC transporter ATP-binding protein [Tannerella sp.]|jgi:zinc transport system ATP-binding protein|nr:ABC transporter ATP-binding protein [Tannerella sp.]
MKDKRIEISHVSVSYGTKTVLRDVSFCLREDDFLGVIGPNGGGKTTLLKVILELVKPSEGSVTFYRNGQKTPSLKFGYLPQINKIDKQFPVSVYEVVASGLMAEKRIGRRFTAEQRRQTDEVIAQMGLEHLAGTPVGRLSGGELQRALLGRSMISRPEILILDEPNTYVDKWFEVRLYELLAEINRTTAIILVSHDVGTILPIVKNIVCVNESLHYHPGNDLTSEWLDEYYHCPIELIGHGDFPHRILKKHDES